MKHPSAHDIIAFAVSEGWTTIPYDIFLELSPTDPLYKSLISAWKDKQRREDYRNGLLCSVIANCSMAGGKYQPKDFMPQDSNAVVQDSELKVKEGFARYAAANNKK